jgi:hypothetical protein
VVEWHDSFSTRGSELTDAGPYSKFAAVCANASAGAPGSAGYCAAHNDPELAWEMSSVESYLGRPTCASPSPGKGPDSNSKSLSEAFRYAPAMGECDGERLSSSQLLLLQTDRQILQEKVRSLQEQLRKAAQESESLRLGRASRPSDLEEPLAPNKTGRSSPHQQQDRDAGDGFSRQGSEAAVESAGLTTRQRRSQSPERLALAGASQNRSILLSPVQDMLRHSIAHSPLISGRQDERRSSIRDGAWERENADEMRPLLDDSVDSFQPEQHPIQFSVRSCNDARLGESIQARKISEEDALCESTKVEEDRASALEEEMVLRELKVSVARALEGLSSLLAAASGQRGDGQLLRSNMSGGTVGTTIDCGSGGPSSSRASLMGSSSGGETRRSRMDTYRQADEKEASRIVALEDELGTAKTMLRQERERARGRDYEIHSLQVCYGITDGWIIKNE